MRSIHVATRHWGSALVLGAATALTSALVSAAEGPPCDRPAAQARQPGTGPEGADRARLQGRLEELKEQIGLRVKDGQYERAEALRRELMELAAKLEGRPAAEPMRRQHEAGAEGDRRQQHLRVAIENLRQAGMQEPAEHLGRELQRMEQETRERAVRQAHAEQQKRQAAERGGVERQLAELREQVQALRRDVAELREALKRQPQRIEPASPKRQ